MSENIDYLRFANNINETPDVNTFDMNRVVIFTNYNDFDGKIYVRIDKTYTGLQTVNYKLFSGIQIIQESGSTKLHHTFENVDEGEFYVVCEILYRHCIDVTETLTSNKLCCQKEKHCDKRHKHCKSQGDNKHRTKYVYKHELLCNCDRYQIEIWFNHINGYEMYLNDKRIHRKYILKKLYTDDEMREWPDLRENFYNCYKIEAEIPIVNLIKIAEEFDALEYVYTTSITPLDTMFIPDPPPDAIPRPPVNTNPNSTTPNFVPLQTYLNAFNGMNVANAWQQGETGRGAVVRFMDFGIFHNHEDLLGNIVVRHGQGSAPNHGTASNGVISGKNNGFGVTGIAYNAQNNIYGTDNIDDIVRDAQPGDIVGICNQIGLANGALVPMTYSFGWWSRAKTMVDRGVVVLFAAGNGGNNLRTATFFVDHGDNGSILVGACDFQTGRRLSFSNYNHSSSVMNSWGHYVTTTGYGDLQRINNDRNYTHTYNGTSSATPLTVAALANIQAHAIRRGTFLNCTDFRQFIALNGYNEGVRDGIGYRPNVARAHEFIR